MGARAGDGSFLQFDSFHILLVLHELCQRFAVKSHGFLGFFQKLFLRVRLDDFGDLGRFQFCLLFIRLFTRNDCLSYLFSARTQ